MLETNHFRREHTTSSSDSEKPRDNASEMEARSFEEDLHVQNNTSAVYDSEDSYETSRSSQMDVEYRDKWFEDPEYFHGAVNPRT